MATVPPSAEAALPAFGLLGSSATPSGRGVVKIARGPGKDIEYVEPPIGHGSFGIKKWEKDRSTDPAGYMFKADAADLAKLISLEEWRQQLRGEFPNGVIASRNSTGAKKIAAFARQLLQMAETLHAAGWRLGLLGPKTVFIDRDDPSKIFLPDLGFAWMGKVEAAKPDWLKIEADDALRWNEERLVKQYTAPAHVRRHPNADDPKYLVGRDLHAVGQLLRYLVAGALLDPTQPSTGKCPVGTTAQEAIAGKFAAASQMRDALLERLKQPTEPLEPKRTPKPNPLRLALVALVPAVLIAAVAGWWFFVKDKGTADATTPSSAATEPTTAPSTPSTKAAADPASVQGLVDRVNGAKTLEDAGAAAAELAKLDPNHAKVAETRAKLLAEITVLWNIGQAGGHVPGRSRILNDLYKQLTPTKAK